MAKRAPAPREEPAERQLISAEVERYFSELAAHGFQAPASTEAGGRSVRQIRRACGIARIRPDLVERADNAGEDTSWLISLAESLGIDVEQACSTRVLNGEVPYRGSMGSDWGSNQGPPSVITGPGLYSRLALLGDVASAKALSVNYKAMTIGANWVGTCAPWGEMRVSVDLELPDDGICVDAGDMLSILRSLSDAPFSCTIEGNALRWSCGTRRGHLPLIDATVGAPDATSARHRITGNFGRGLELGALACASTALSRSAGLEGVQIYNRDGQAYAAAADSMVISECCLGPALPIADGAVVTLKAEAVSLLAEVVKREIKISKNPDTAIGIDGTSVSVVTPDTELRLHQLAPLKYNLAERLEPYRQRKVALPLQHETITAFLKCAEALAEVRSDAVVDIGADAGRVSLTFREAAGAVDEFYLVQGGPEVSVPPVRLEVKRLARALGDSDELVFDYADQHVMILRGPGDFIFGIAGRH